MFAVKVMFRFIFLFVFLYFPCEIFNTSLIWNQFYKCICSGIYDTKIIIEMDNVRCSTTSTQSQWYHILDVYIKVLQRSESY